MLAAVPPQSAASAEASKPPPARYGFAGAFLGEGIEEWRGRRGASAALGCARAPNTTAIVVCRGPDIPLGGGYRARRLSYLFVGDRLAEISFEASIDAFDNVTASLKRAFGDPSLIARDTLKRSGFPHVAMTWRNGRSTIHLSDPLTDYANLGVRLTLDALARQLPRALEGDADAS
jgi:hypothetical protein